MSIVPDSAHQGHRERLRERFSRSPQMLSDLEYLELLLTYAIPRMDVRPIAIDLLERFGNLEGVVSASFAEIKQVKGMGDSTVLFVNLICMVANRMSANMTEQNQPLLFPSDQVPVHVKVREMRVFANDEIETALQFLPRAAECPSLADFKNLLEQELPYNSQDTRQRRANYILDRYYPAGSINTPLSAYAQHFQSGDGLKSVVFYQLAKAEPILAKAADEFIFPALPLGKISRDALREFILGYLPEIKSASQAKVLRSIFYAYTLLGVGRTDGEYLKFQLHPGSQDAFAYVLMSEYPEPGIYSFDSLFDGPAHRWLLWDRDWIRKQLYLLRDLGIVSKVSEIDTVRQFSLEFGQKENLARYYQAIQNKPGSDTEL
ncbi:MAG: hypothetical protein NTW32_26690 [Chloroflexi bacterium]|nr:hypothetical protein [Chloroflexota bacterium]